MYVCVCVRANSAPPLTEDRGNWFSSLLKRTICYFLKEKKCRDECWWCKLSCLNTHTHTVYKPQCRFGGVSSSENASRRSDGWCVFEPCTLVTYNTTQSSWPPEGIRRLRNWHLDCANFNTLLSNSPSCAGLIVRVMLLWPCGVIGAVIEFDSCYSGSAAGARAPTAVPDSCGEEGGTVT